MTAPQKEVYPAGHNLAPETLRITFIIQELARGYHGRDDEPGYDFTRSVDEHQAGYAFRRSVEAVKKAVPLADYAGELIELKRSGLQLVGVCPLPDHDENTPSFTIYPDGHWWCFGCERGSDILDLHQLMYGHPEKWTALVDLSMRYGVELPGRSEKWLAGERRKRLYTDKQNLALGGVLKRRLFKILVLPYIDAIEDPGEHDEELARAWEDFGDELWWARVANEVLS
jgi:hypothetical protein